MYYYVYNLQGDVTHIIDSTGAIKGTYQYDAWGKILNFGSLSAIAQANPFRYRGYYYDNESGLYYLNSRYYNAEWGRFINADNAIADVGGDIRGYNLFAYCMNNPVNLSDESGNWPQWIKNSVKWVASKVAKPAVDYLKSAISKIDGTRTVGLSANATSGIGVSGSFGITSDNKGNVGVIITVGGMGGTPSAGVNIFKNVTTAPTIYKQKDKSVPFGGSVDISGVTVGAEYNLFTDSETNDIYHGMTVSVGVGASMPLEFHTGLAHSFVYGVNVYDIFDDTYIRIMEW